MHIRGGVARSCFHRPGLSAGDAHPFEEVVADAQRVGDDSQGRVHRPARGEKAAVDNVKIVDVVRLAIDVQGAAQRVGSEADRAVLMSHTGKRNLLPDKEISVEEALVATGTMNIAGRLLHYYGKLVLQTFMRLEIIRRITQHDFVCGVNGHAILRIRKVFGG